jgi:hypothetical protein
MKIKITHVDFDGVAVNARLWQQVYVGARAVKGILLAIAACRESQPDCPAQRRRNTCFIFYIYILLLLLLFKKEVKEEEEDSQESFCVVYEIVDFIS